MNLPPSIEKALTLPSGARFYRCALQVNPYAYVQRHLPATPFDSEAAYNAAMIQSADCQMELYLSGCLSVAGRLETNCSKMLCATMDISNIWGWACPAK